MLDHRESHGWRKADGLAMVSDLIVGEKNLSDVEKKIRTWATRRERPEEVSGS